ncbi:MULTISPECIES: hypothetical protein [unclassified Streptomyces]|nr:MULTISPECIES: hypothetical protein [unclassified Streptomyces]ODA70187.1 hypothetical protein APS67_005659 [Streptomyces sp. AVP053U2]
MKAAVVRAFDGVRVGASGLCRTGVHAAHGDRPVTFDLVVGR